MNESPENVAAAEREAYDELCSYTLALADRGFVHQHVVDAWAAQQADERTRPITLTFALVGLYLHLERGFSGRQVQRVHGVLARRRREWPSFSIPRRCGMTTASDVIAAAAGSERDRAIDAWCTSVWEAFAGNRRAIVELLAQYGIA